MIPVPDRYSSNVSQVGDIALQLRYYGRVVSFYDRTAFDALLLLCAERGMSLTFDVLEKLWDEYEARKGRRFDPGCVPVREFVGYLDESITIDTVPIYYW